LFMISLVATVVSALSAFGYPFDLFSSYRWYWIFIAVLSAGIWGLSRGWKMVAASFLIMAINLFVTLPASGNAPTGGKTATAVLGWANVASNGEALTRVFKDADKKQATLLMIAEAPQSVFTPPAGWTLIEAPLAGDPTAIAVFSKGSWRAATVPGEPTMARPPAGDLTVIGVHPPEARKNRRSTPERDALINRSGTRAGIQEGPTVVLGDFGAAPWHNDMRQFKDYGNVTRVRCGGFTGSTLSQVYGVIGIAADHAFVRDVRITHCKLGSSLIGGNHKPIWLYVAPQAPPTEVAKP
jgi:endonuclease/exonuclease/phosphatase (EEP) superfamily protein YafD